MRYGVEFQCADGPLMTRSLHVALSDLKLERAGLMHLGTSSHPVHVKMTACWLPTLPEELSRTDGVRMRTASLSRAPACRARKESKCLMSSFDPIAPRSFTQALTGIGTGQRAELRTVRKPRGSPTRLLAVPREADRQCMLAVIELVGFQFAPPLKT